jgi:hypothetical protein
MTKPKTNVNKNPDAVDLGNEEVNESKDYNSPRPYATSEPESKISKEGKPMFNGRPYDSKAEKEYWESKEAAVTKKLPAVLHKNERPVVEDSIAYDADDELDEICEGYYRWIMDTITDAHGLPRVLGTGKSRPLSPSELKVAINRLYIKRSEANKRVASDIFNLAHEYASEDETMRGSEELRAYHYYNAIHKIGEFDDR